MDGLPLNIVDIVVLGITLISGLIAATRGFARSLLGLGVWIGAGLVALYGVAPLRPLLAGFIESSILADIAGATLLFLFALVTLGILKRSLLGNMGQDGLAASLDTGLGFLFGLVRGLLIICLPYLLASLAWTNLDTRLPREIQEARSFPYLKEVALHIGVFLPEGLELRLRKMQAEASQTAEDIEALRDIGKRLNAPAPAPDPADPDAGEPFFPPGYGEPARSELDALIEQSQSHEGRN